MGDDDRPRIVNSRTGEEYEVTATRGHGFAIGRDGIVRYHVVEDGEVREAGEEPLWRSPVRDVFAPWVWDLLDDALDPRNG